MTNDQGHIWRQIEQVLSTAAHRVILVAPFIKTDVFAAVLDAIPTGVRDLTCVTRWSVAEVAAGVSDPEIITLAEDDGRCTIKLCHALHAKLVLVDNRALVGSANLTGRATGRVQPENIEVLVEVDANHQEVAHLLERIDATSVPATTELAKQTRQYADLLATGSRQHVPDMPGQSDDARGFLPVTRAPERLFPVYRGAPGDPPRNLLAGLIADLAQLDLPPGLDHSSFNIAVQLKLRALPALRDLFERGQVHNNELVRLLIELYGLDSTEAEQTADNLTVWLRHFDQIHTVPVGGWEIRRGPEHR